MPLENCIFLCNCILFPQLVFISENSKLIFNFTLLSFVYIPQQKSGEKKNIQKLYYTSPYTTVLQYLNKQAEQRPI